LINQLFIQFVLLLLFSCWARNNWEVVYLLNNWNNWNCNVLIYSLYIAVVA